MGRPRILLLGLFVTAVFGGVTGCEEESRDLVLPDTEVVAAWFGDGTEVTLDGNVMEIRATMDPDFLRRGGRIWARSGPYFYLFNVHIQQLLVDYADLAAIRARTFTEDGEEVAVALLMRNELSEARWREALARSSLAQQDGTTNPRVIERLIQFGEDHTTFAYGPLAR